MASAPSARRYIRRFGRTERTLHWTHAAAFFVLLATGLILWIPDLATAVAHRRLVKDVHLLTAIAWGVAIVLIVVLGDRRALAADWREIERLDRDDRRWLSLRKAPQGRFNAGQKLNAIATAAFAPPLRRVGDPALAGRPRQPLPYRRADRRPRHADLPVDLPRRRAPLPGGDPPDDASCPARDDPRRRARGLGRQAPLQVGGRARRRSALIAQAPPRGQLTDTGSTPGSVRPC